MLYKIKNPTAFCRYCGSPMKIVVQDYPRNRMSGWGKSYDTTTGELDTYEEEICTGSQTRNCEGHRHCFSRHVGGWLFGDSYCKCGEGEGDRGTD